MTRQTGNEPFELHEATVAGLQEGMESGRRTARSITELYLARIEALNRQGPELRAGNNMTTMTTTCSTRQAPP